jgi:hypothetical protein
MKALQSLNRFNLWVLVGVLLTSVLPACATPSVLSFKERPLASSIRSAGMRADRSVIPQLLEIINKPGDKPFISVSMHTLARLGAAEALPEFDKMLRSPDVDVWTITVFRARLVAEASSQNEPNPNRRAALAVDTFLSELKLTPRKLNEQVDAFYHGPIHRHLPTLPVRAMRELADMVFEGPYPSYLHLPAVQATDFSLDYPSELKIQMGRLSPEERDPILINKIAGVHALFGNTTYDAQLLADDGLVANTDIAAKLQDMVEHRGDYQTGAFEALLMIMCRTTEQASAWVFQHFAHDPDPAISDTARSVLNVGPFDIDY